MNKGIKLVLLMKKNRSQKSHASVPLTLIRAAGGVYDFRNFEEI